MCSAEKGSCCQNEEIPVVPIEIDNISYITVYVLNLDSIKWPTLDRRDGSQI